MIYHLSIAKHNNQKSLVLRYSLRNDAILVHGPSGLILQNESKKSFF